MILIVNYANRLLGIHLFSNDRNTRRRITFSLKHVKIDNRQDDDDDTVI